MKATELVVISTFRSVADAQIAKGILDEVGIDSAIRSDNAGGMYPALDSAELVVREEQAGIARDALTRRHRRLKRPAC
jgi:uridine phosphorylase